MSSHVEELTNVSTSLWDNLQFVPAFTLNDLETTATELGITYQPNAAHYFASPPTTPLVLEPWLGIPCHQ